MPNNLVRLPGADHAIRTLHAEIERLATAASQAYVTRTPLRVDRSGRTEIHWWLDDPALKVFTAEDGVFISGTMQLQYWPDWYALDRTGARRIAHALLSAAEAVDTPEAADDGE